MRQMTLSGSGNVSGPSRSTLGLQAAVGSKLHGRYGAARSLDLLRQNIQSLVNQDIQSVLNKYLEKFFQPAMANIRKNLGDDSLTEHSLRIVCIQMLEEAKVQYYASSNKSNGCLDTSQSFGGKTLSGQDRKASSSSVSVPVVSTASGDSRSFPSQSVIYKRKDIEVDSGWERTRKKIIKTTTSVLPGTTTPIKLVKLESIKREGPKWDPNRITSSTLFIMGARANKVLGFGQNRGRLYTKHPELMKYSGDTEDKEWLSRNNLMPPTGGIAYLLVLDDIKELSLTDEYRYNPNVLLRELKGFQAPEFMLMKIRMFMAKVRTEGQETTYQYYDNNFLTKNQNGPGILESASPMATSVNSPLVGATTAQATQTSPPSYVEPISTTSSDFYLPPRIALNNQESFQTEYF